MRRPTKRVVTARSSDNVKRRLKDPIPDQDTRSALIARATFAGSAKHKLHPRAFGLEPAPSDEDDTYCDGHAGFAPADMTRLPVLLRRGISVGLIGDNDKKGDPTLLWTIDDDGWIFEGRITTPTQAVYHGYPLLPGDAFARKVIERVASGIDGGLDPSLKACLLRALERYR